jgi:hypothetical protein
MDPSVLLKQRSVQWSDPLDDYSKLQTLRQMMDQRRIREQQYQLQQQAMQEHARKAQYEQEDRTRQESLRQYLSSNPNAGFSDIAKFDLPTALKLETERRQMQTAQRTAEEAKLKLGKGRAASLSDLMASNRLLPADQRQENWDDAWGGIPVDLAPSEAQAQAQEVLGYGQKEQEARQAAKNKATQDALLFGPQFLKARMDAQKAQTEVLEGKPSTGTLAEFESAFYPGWLAAKGLPKSAENQYKAYLDWQEGRRPRIAVPGVDVPYSPAVAQQKVEMATAGREAKPPTAGEEVLAGYAARVKQANKGFENVTMGDAERAWNRVTPEFFNTDAGKVFAQDERNFINSILRRESGAVISPSEFAEARKQYIPQLNDPPAALERKRQNRLIVQQSMIRGAGKAYVDPEQLLKEAGGAPAKPAGGGGATPTHRFNPTTGVLEVITR